MILFHDTKTRSATMKKWLSLLLSAAFLSLSFAGCALGTTEHVHADADKNDYCDGCHAPIRVTFDLFSVNDLHGKFDDTYANEGVDEMTTYLRNAQADNPYTIVLSAGDMWQGSAESNYTKGALVTEWMNDVGFAAMTLGNHEFDWGETYIQSNAELAEFPLLAINVFDKATRKRAAYCDASVMVEKNGVKIGVIGAIGDCYSSIAAEQCENVYFEVNKNLTTLVKAESVKLREQGANAIVYVLHDSDPSGYSHYDTSLSNGYVDLVFEAHTHYTVRKQDAHGVWHLQAGGDNNVGLSHAELTVDLLNSDVSVKRAEIVKKNMYADLTDDPVVDTLLDKYADELAPVTQTLGTNVYYRNAKALATYAAKAYYAVGKARWGNDPLYRGKIVLGGGYINVRSPDYLPPGDVSYGDLYPLFPFDNPLVLCKVSGSRLKSQFINSTNYYVYYGADGEAVKNNVVDDETYYVVVDTYCANYNFNRLGYLEIVDYYDEDRLFYSRDAIVAYTRAGGLSASPPSPETFAMQTDKE